MRSLTFLDLPQDVRFKIYGMSGLVRTCAIDMVNEGQLKKIRRPRARCIMNTSNSYSVRINDLDCHCPELPVSILRVSRKIYEEAMPILYGENCLMVLGRCPEHIEFLKSIPTSAIRYLLVRLNCWPCVLGHDLVNFNFNFETVKCLTCHQQLKDADEPLTEDKREMLDAWKLLVPTLRLHPDLWLSFIADVQTQAMGKEVISSLPSVKCLDVRLGRKRDPDLQSIAMRSETKPFAFNLLPTEIQLRILNYTHLSWNDSYNDRHASIDIRDNKLWSLEDEVTRCCGYCNHSGTLNCMCMNRYASSSTYCQCRLIPFELFLVSQQLYAESTRIFYSQNTFNFRQSPELTLAFLESRSLTALRLITRIRLEVQHEKVYYEGPLAWKRDKEAWKKLFTFINTMRTDNLCVMFDTSLYFEVMVGTDTPLETKAVHDDMIQALSVLQVVDIHLFLPDPNWEIPYEQQLMGKEYHSLIGNKYPKIR